MMLMGYGCGEQQADWHVDDRVPPSWSRIYLIDRGTVRYECNGARRTLKPGALYIFPSYTAYHLEHDPWDPICCLWFHLDLFPTLVSRLIEIRVDEACAHLMAAIRCEVLSEHPSAGYLMSLMEAFAQLCHKLRYLNAPDGRLGEILAYMGAHYAEPLSIEALGLRFGYAPAYFIRLFRSKVGITPHQYLIGCRMNEALLLLRGEAPIGEIAQRVGYADGKSFGNAFQARYGISPTIYRTQFVPQA